MRKEYEKNNVDKSSRWYIKKILRIEFLNYLKRTLVIRKAKCLLFIMVQSEKKQVNFLRRQKWFLFLVLSKIVSLLTSRP